MGGSADGSSQRGDENESRWRGSEDVCRVLLEQIKLLNIIFLSPTL